LGFAQEFINYEQVYREAMQQSGTKQSEEEIARGIEEAEKAFRLAYRTVFRHAVAPFNPDRFKSMVASSLGLEDLRQWLERFLKSNGRRLMWREDQKLWEFLVPDEIKSLLPAGRKAVTGTFDRELAMRDQTVELLAFGHPIIDLILRSALAPDSSGTAFLTVGNETAGREFTAWVLLRDNTDSSANAFRLLTIRRQSDGVCRLLTKESFPKPSTPGDAASIDLPETKAAFLEFLANQYPDIDFIEDRVCWLVCAVCAENHE
jgi:hypothetical protein